jgi:hypothetical protein
MSGDVICDETFASTVAETWKPFHDALALRPTASFIPDSYTVMEHTGDLLSQFEEGNATANNDQTATTSPFEEDIIHSDLISDPVEDSSEEDTAEDPEERVKKQPIQILSLRLWMMAWIPRLGGTTELGSHQNLTFKDFQAARN